MRRLTFMVAILAFPITELGSLACWGDEPQGQTVAVPGEKQLSLTSTSILHQAIVAADDAMMKDAHLWTAIAATLARAGHADDALRLADGRQGQVSRETIIRVTAIAQARSANFAGALRSARLLQGPESRQVVAIIAAEQAWAGDVTVARRTVEVELAGEPESLHALQLIAHVLEQKEDLVEAARTYETLPSLKEKARGCRPAALARLKGGDIPGAARAADEARRLSIDYLAQKPLRRGQASSMVFDIGPDSIRDGILGEIVLEQARRGDARGVRKTAESLRRVEGVGLVEDDP